MVHSPPVPGLTDGDVSALQLLRSRGRMRGAVALFGPAFVAAVAYIDPGNFATNFSAGAKFGYALIWVIVAANLMAMVVQYLSAKMGVATGRDLPELCREHLPRPVSRGLWVQAEIVAMATDLAEFVGAAVGLNLLFHVPLFPAGLITAVVAFAHPGDGAARLSSLRAGDRCPAGHRAARLCLRPRAGRRRPVRCRGRARAELSRLGTVCCSRLESSARP